MTPAGAGPGTVTDPDLDLRCVNTIRALCLDAIQQANSGLPEGHAAPLLWSLLHLSRVRAVEPDYEVPGRPAVTLDDLKTFRQLDSKCPGHPEYHWTSGVETTTGPPGQGAATSVGMAIAGQWLAARYNADGFPLFDFGVYALAGSGCMMAGLSSEAASLAGHHRLANLCWIYDSSPVTGEGRPDITLTEDVAARFTAYGWNVTTVADPDDLPSVFRAFEVFRAERERPTLILVHSHTDRGWPVPDTPRAQGEPVRPAGVAAAKRFLGAPADRHFYVPDAVCQAFRKGIGARGREARQAWQEILRDYRSAYPGLADELDRMQALPTFDRQPAGYRDQVLPRSVRACLLARSGGADQDGRWQAMRGWARPPRRGGNRHHSDRRHQSCRSPRSGTGSPIRRSSGTMARSPAATCGTCSRPIPAVASG